MSCLQLSNLNAVLRLGATHLYHHVGDLRNKICSPPCDVRDGTDQLLEGAILEKIPGYPGLEHSMDVFLIGAPCGTRAARSTVRNSAVSYPPFPECPYGIFTTKIMLSQMVSYPVLYKNKLQVRSM